MGAPFTQQFLKTEVSGGGGTPAPTLPAAPTPGNLCVCADLTQGVAAFTAGINGWVQRSGGNDGGNGRGAWYIRLAQAGDTATLPAMYSGTVANPHSLHCWEVANCIDVINDTRNTGIGPGGGVQNTPLLSPAGITNALFLSAILYEDTTPVPNITVNTPWLLRNGNGHAGPVASGSAEYTGVDATSQQATYNNSDTLTNQRFVGLIMALWGTTTSSADGAFVLQDNLLFSGTRFSTGNSDTNDVQVDTANFTEKSVGAESNLAATDAFTATEIINPYSDANLTLQDFAAAKVGLASSDTNAAPTDTSTMGPFVSSADTNATPTDTAALKTYLLSHDTNAAQSDSGQIGTHRMIVNQAVLQVLQKTADTSYTLDDFIGRLIQLLAPGWQSKQALMRGGQYYSLLYAFANNLMLHKDSIDYTRLQTRLMSATGRNLTQIGSDFLGPKYHRIVPQDIPTRHAIQSAVLSEGCTVEGMQKVLNNFFPTPSFQNVNPLAWDEVTDPVDALAYGISSPQFVIQATLHATKGTGWFLNRAFLNRTSYLFAVGILTPWPNPPIALIPLVTQTKAVGTVPVYLITRSF